MALWDENLQDINENTKIDSGDIDLKNDGVFARDLIQPTDAELESIQSGSNNLNELGDSSHSDDSETDSNILEPIEKLLIQLALVRIRRARQKGKTHVKLNKEEIAALEKRKRILHETSVMKAKRKIGTSDNRGSQTSSKSINIPLTSSFISDHLEPSHELEIPSDFNEQSNILNSSSFVLKYPSNLMSSMESSDDNFPSLHNSVNYHLSSTSRPFIGDRNYSHEPQSFSSRGIPHYANHGPNMPVGSSERFIPHLDPSRYQFNTDNPLTPKFVTTPYKYPINLDSKFPPVQPTSLEPNMNITTTRLRWRVRDSKDESSLKF
ncbi:putative prenylated rab acceptor 1 [Erysiphe necator]|uniref:Putative prenylated rab acceptor 1 n=1 Tax=Uncinula necator TaxID=52586 RepID=A0A0B1P9H6_UNCNE|nr:putative prenylated rab acceptor 1 [Erysiphe necator]